jgi:hypothetical protein
MRRVRNRLTYANVMSTLCFFLLAGGGAAYAASHLGRNSVGAKQLKNNAVTSAKIKKGAITAAKLAGGSVGAAQLQANSITGANVEDGTLTGADINQGSLNHVRAANVTSMSFTEDESCSPSLPLPAGVASKRNGDGACVITFPSPVADCTANATVHFRPTGSMLLVVESRSAQIVSKSSEPTTLAVDTYEGPTLTKLPFDLVLVC